MLGCTLASRIIVAAKTSSTPAGGFAMVLHSPRSFLSRVLSAAIAASTMGSAMARSLSVEDCLADTSSWMMATSLACTWALAVSTSTMAFSFDTTSAMPSDTVLFWSAASSEIFRSASICSTAAAVSRSLVRPLDRRSIPSSASLRFEFSSTPYNFSNSRKDLGVVYTKRLSTRLNTTASLLTSVKEKGRKRSIESRTSPKSTSAMNLLPTLNSASKGQGWNQSMTVEFTMAGNFRARVRKASPTGEKANTTCRLRRMRFMK